jgi:hypothetical protein
MATAYAVPAAVAALAVAAFAAYSSEDEKPRMILGDVAAACIAAVVVTPLTQIVDVAVSRSAGGDTTVLAALVQGAGEWLSKPLHMLRQPAFSLCCFVYICTYSGANVIECVCTLYLGISPVLPKLVVATLANMGACLYKDAALARIFGKTEDPRPFPTLGYVFFLVRDVLANVGGFTLPPLVGPLLRPYFGASADMYAQLGVPAAMNLVTTPFHFYALDLYNNPDASVGAHLKAVGRVYFSASFSRICKGFAAFGLGGVSNKKLRVLIGSL